MNRLEPMPTNPKQILNDSMNVQESLSLVR